METREEDVGKSYFNPRSLAGATFTVATVQGEEQISIHAPLRERRQIISLARADYDFNPRSLAGATCKLSINNTFVRLISIHAPLRERPD